MKHILILLFGIVTATAWGQLGETPDQCDKSFGPALSSNKPDSSWSFSRDYSNANYLVTARFITLSTGAKVVGWISYTPATTNAADRHKPREAAARSWTPVEESTISNDMDPNLLELTKIHNEFITETRALFRQVTGWNSMHCWISSSVYACDNGVSLILFTDAYLAEFKRHQPQAPKQKP